MNPTRDRAEVVMELALANYGKRTTPMSTPCNCVGCRVKRGVYVPRLALNQYLAANNMTRAELAKRRRMAA